MEHSAILSTFIRLPFVIKVFVLSIFEWPLKTYFTVNVHADYRTKGLNLVFIQTVCIRAAMTLVWLCVCTGPSEHSQLAYVISTHISSTC